MPNIETKVYEEVKNNSYSSDEEKDVALLMSEGVTDLEEIQFKTTISIQREIDILLTKLTVKKYKIANAHNCIVHMIKREAA